MSAPDATRPARGEMRKVIVGAALGTMFEWYDFFLYGSLAGLIAEHFFSAVNPTTGFILALATFAVGFIVRPLGALVFGRMGDLHGRKITFLTTLVLMGLSTFLVGLLPGYAAIGIAAPLMLVTLRIAQGLAIGGEFGGAIVYVAEHAPAGRRGFHTSFIPAMAIGGLLLSLLVIMATRASMTPAEFAARGWRLPFLLSAILLGISLWIRLRLQESPVFRAMQERRALSRAPLSETFLDRGNRRLVLIALFGCVMGQAVLFYTSTFYAYHFLERIARVDAATVTLLSGIALAVCAPVLVFFGWVSDRWRRKPLMLASFGLAVVLFFPLFGALLSAANPGLAAARESAPVTVRAREGDCSLQLDFMGRRRFDERSCDIVKSLLARAGVSHATETLPGSGPAQLAIGGQLLVAPEPAALDREALAAAVAEFRAHAEAALTAAGYRPTAEGAAINRPAIVAILIALLVLACMGTGAYTPMLVELFPARIRYSGLSFAQNFGNGWFGGILPAVAFAIVAATGSVFAGLWYPVAITAVCFLVGAALLPETRGRPID